MFIRSRVRCARGAADAVFNDPAPTGCDYTLCGCGFLVSMCGVDGVDVVRRARCGVYPGRVAGPG